MIPKFSPRGPQLAEGRLRLPRPLWQHQIHFSTVRHRWSGLRRSVFRLSLVFFVMEPLQILFILVSKMFLQSFTSKIIKDFEKIRIVKWIMRWWLFSEKCHGAQVSWPPSGFALKLRVLNIVLKILKIILEIILKIMRNKFWKYVPWWLYYWKGYFKE